MVELKLGTEQGPLAEQHNSAESESQAEQRSPAEPEQPTELAEVDSEVDNIDLDP